ncbi:MAG: hypothetical protein JO051_00455 [Acidobacteriaceae bacterium]|nr:hypothetical protein [Acidobacteriaceae bacterium]
MLPGYDISAQGSIITVQERSPAGWLDYRIKKFSVNFAPLEFNSMQIFFALQYQLNPHRGGIAGSLPSAKSDDTVGPFTEYDRRIEQLLNDLITKSSRGGAWIVVDGRAQVGAPPVDKPFWKVIPYGISDRDLIQLLPQ